MSNEIPPGFAPHDRKSPVTDPWEPLFARRDEDGHVQLGVRLATPHCNARGFAHGGVIAALADNAMGLSCVARRRLVDPEGAAGAVTVSLNIDYVAAARTGAWLTVAPRVIKAGGSIAFVEALVTADGEIIARAAATFRILG